MRQRASILATVAAAAVAALVFAGRTPTVRGQGRQEPRFAAVPGEKGGQDMFGGYEIVPNWPKPLSSLPGNEKWTWGAGQSVFAESPNRVFILQRGELPEHRAAEEDQAAAARARASSSRLAACPGATRRRPALPGRSNATERWATIRTSASPASTSTGTTASSSWTPTATSSRTGRSGTRCCGGPTPSTSARTIRRSASGSSTITGTPSSFSPTTASGCCRPSASPTCTPPTTSTSTGRRSSRGCPTARSSSPTATPTRAS